MNSNSKILFHKDCERERERGGGRERGREGGRGREKGREGEGGEREEGRGRERGKPYSLISVPSNVRLWLDNYCLFRLI